MVNMQGTVFAEQFLPSNYCNQNVAHVSQFCTPLPVPTTSLFFI